MPPFIAGVIVSQKDSPETITGGVTDHMICYPRLGAKSRDLASKPESIAIGISEDEQTPAKRDREQVTPSSSLETKQGSLGF